MPTRSVVDPQFASTLRLLIANSGMTQAQVAASAYMSAGYLSELVKGLKTPGADKVRQLDDVLGADGALVNLINPLYNDADSARLADATAQGARISRAGIDSLTHVLASHRDADDTLGSVAIEAPTRQHMDTIRNMVRYARGPVRPDLMRCAAQWAQFYGWLQISVGRFDDAEEWLRIALQWVVEAGDHDLQATVVSYLGHVAWLRGELGDTIGLAATAMRDPDVYVGQRAYDAFQAGRAYAAVGDVGEALNMLALARQLGEESNAYTGDLPAWQYYRAPWLWQVEEGIALRYLARHDRTRAGAAVAALRAGTTGVPEHMRNADWYAEYLLHLVAALTDADQLGEAADLLTQAKTIATAAGSKRVLGIARVRQRRLDTAGRTDPRPARLAVVRQLRPT